MNVAFDASVTTRLQSWIQDAINRITFPLDAWGHDVTFELVSEPPCTGHKDYMCTQTDSGASTIFIREGADDPDSPINGWLPAGTDIKAWFQESIAHEIGHAYTFDTITDDEGKEALGDLFVHDVDGDRRTAVLADWNPTSSPWPDRLQEAVAEVWKDVFFPQESSVFDNRSNWSLPVENRDAFFAALSINLSGGSDSNITTFNGVLETVTGADWSEPPAWDVGSLCMDGLYNAYVPSEPGELYVVPEGIISIGGLFDPEGDPVVVYGIKDDAGCWPYNSGEREPKLISGEDYTDVVFHIDNDFSKYAAPPYTGWSLHVIIEAEVDLTPQWAAAVFNGSTPNGFNPGDGQTRIVINPLARLAGDSWAPYKTPTIWGFMGVAKDAAFSEWAGRDLTGLSGVVAGHNWKQGEPYDNVYTFPSFGNAKNPRYLRAAPTAGHSIIGISAYYIGGTGVNKEMELGYDEDGVHIWYRFIEGPIYVHNAMTDAAEIKTFTISNPVGYAHLSETVDLPPVPLEWPDAELSVGQGPTGVQRMS
jgi:hypothetical protein